MTNELKTILFLHILAAMVMVAGVFGFLLLYLRARAADDAAEARATLVNARDLVSRLLLPGAGLAGLLGLLLMLRYHQTDIFDAGKQGWIHTSIVLWLVLNVLAGLQGRFVQRAVDAAGDSERGGLPALKAALASGPLVALTVVNTLLSIVILYLMVFQPFVSD